MTFGDGIDWDAEAHRAATQETPGAAPGDMLLNINEALADIHVPGHKIVVDCGCNIGRFYPQFARAGYAYIGVDQSEEALRIAGARWAVPVPGEIAPVFLRSMLWDPWSYSGPFPGYAAICNAVLQHNTLDEKRRILPRIAEAVRPGGVFAMQESTVLEETRTQLQHAQWIRLVESYGFKLLKTWHPNPEYGVHDGYLFRRI